MRLPGRLSAAIEVLADVEARHRPVAEALKAWGLNNRFAGAGDRAAIGNIVYDALRRRASHAFAMGSESPRALVLAVAVFDWGITPEELNDLFAGDTHAPETLSVEEVQRLVAEDPLDGAPEWVRADVPEWVVPELRASFGAFWREEGRAMTGRPALDLRVNLLKSDRARVLKSLERVAAEPAAVSPVGVRIAAGERDSRTPNVQADEGYLKGWFEVQDQGSQLVALLAGAEPGEQVLDLCAGAGGKTLALAAQMNNRGQIFAHDSDRHRLAPIYDRLKRAGARNVQVVVPSDDTTLDGLVGRMDRVVVDAPCTGSGTWRRRPDTKWKLTPEQLAGRVEEQATILDAAVRYVKPGGTLFYITCSVLNAENGAQVAAFLERHTDFEAVPGGGLLDAISPSAREHAHIDARGGILLTPRRTGTDGFFAMALRRR
jgi:16S rRNA (cytosine967-C5)-methyltransferase